jgi:hypothetical protein
MTMTRSGVLQPYLHQRPMEKAPPTRPDVRSSDGDIHRMTGKSQTNSPVRHTYSRLGDHRQGMHTGAANASKSPHITAGRPAQVFSRNGGDNNG